jgi:putative endonuclease
VLTAKQIIGQRAEDEAARFLSARGFKIIARNWRNGSYELDMVCLEDGDLVFVEVRARAADGLVKPAESINAAKKRKLVKAARRYLAQNNAWEKSCRFDVVCVVMDEYRLSTEHIRHAFEFDAPFVGGGHTAWQPW